MMLTNFDIIAEPWWRNKNSNPQSVGNMLNNINHLQKIVQDQVFADLFWKGYVEVQHIRYLLECITGEDSNTGLTYDDVEVLINAGRVKKAFYFLFNRKKLYLLKKLQNLDRATRFTFSNIVLFATPPIDIFHIDFVHKVHSKVGEGIMYNVGKFRSKCAKPSQENFHYVDPDLIEDRLKQLLKETQHVFSNSNLELLEAVKYGACFLANFLYIHPFSNGNGRVGRLLLSFLLTKYTSVPLSLHCSERDHYLQCLRETRYDFGVMKPVSLSRLILENVERELKDLCYMLDLN
jgi:fido (protein-threonine AMPylation protein)